jgi:GNAT superfamily N-acetyltransferase
MIQYQTSLEDVRADQLEGFFVGWPNPPTPTTHLEILKRASFVVLALNGSSVVGFVTAISDRILCAYIPLLEVLPAHQHQGIGSELMRRMLEILHEIYMIDLLCDPARQVHVWDQEAIPTFKRFTRGSGWRNLLGCWYEILYINLESNSLRSFGRAVVHRFDFAVRLQRIRPEFAPVPRLFEPTERCGVANARVGID